MAGHPCPYRSFGSDVLRKGAALQQPLQPPLGIRAPEACNCDGQPRVAEQKPAQVEEHRMPVQPLLSQTTANNNRVLKLPAQHLRLVSYGSSVTGADNAKGARPLAAEGKKFENVFLSGASPSGASSSLALGPTFSPVSSLTAEKRTPRKAQLARTFSMLAPGLQIEANTRGGRRLQSLSAAGSGQDNFASLERRSDLLAVSTPRAAEKMHRKADTIPKEPNTNAIPCAAGGGPQSPTEQRFLQLRASNTSAPVSSGQTPAASTPARIGSPFRAQTQEPLAADAPPNRVTAARTAAAATANFYKEGNSFARRSLREASAADYRRLQLTEPLLYVDGQTHADNVWIRWARKWLVLSVCLLILGFLVADVIFLIQVARNRIIEMPSTVSEAMAVGTAYARIYYGFEFLGALVQMVSFYPFLLENGACGCKRFGVSNRTLRWLSPMFYVFFILIPTTDGQDPLSATQRYMHQLCAMTSFSLFIAAELHTLYCADLVLRFANGEQRRLYPSVGEMTASGCKDPLCEDVQSFEKNENPVLMEKIRVSVRLVGAFGVRLAGAMIRRCTCWPSELLGEVAGWGTSVAYRWRSSFVVVAEHDGGSRTASPQCAPLDLEPAPTGNRDDSTTHQAAAASNDETTMNHLAAPATAVGEQALQLPSSGDSPIVAHLRAEVPAPTRFTSTPPTDHDHSTPSATNVSPSPSPRQFLEEHALKLRTFHMFADERAARLTAVVFSVFSFAGMVALQILWIVGIRSAWLCMLSFMCEMFGALFTFFGLANTWHFSRPQQSSRYGGRTYNPQDSAHVFKRVLDGVAIAGLVLMASHVWVVAFIWSPELAVSNCADGTCKVCLPGTEHDRNVQPGGWRACDSLTSNAVFWTEKLGAGCFCDPKPKLLADGFDSIPSNRTSRDTPDPSLSSDGPQSQPTTARTTPYFTSTGLSQTSGGSLTCRPPAYPYLIDVSPSLMPFSLLRLEGCQVDDVRKLNDPALAYLKVDGNPVSDYSAKGIACALVPQDYAKTGILACKRGVAGSEKSSAMIVYCADEWGRPVSMYSPEIEEACGVK